MLLFFLILFFMYYVFFFNYVGFFWFFSLYQVCKINLRTEKLLIQEKSTFSTCSSEILGCCFFFFIIILTLKTQHLWHSWHGARNLSFKVRPYDGLTSYPGSISPLAQWPLEIGTIFMMWTPGNVAIDTARAKKQTDHVLSFNCWLHVSPDHQASTTKV